MHVSKLDDLQAFTTLDGSTIREIAGPAWTPARNQSLAEATVPRGGATTAHLHRATEELYFFTAGTGRLRVGDDEREVRPGDCAVIPPGTVHKLWNTGSSPLVLLCCCAPAYSDADTVLVEPAA
ncbi:MAG TPA: cupin domain-containing protein [Solirubrobacteraceae bacterium]|nr:cupin domain-containing protein [Solirubrobacteraceae bacterium]